jgi:two-component system, NtrC family, sensor kinase
MMGAGSASRQDTLSALAMMANRVGHELRNPLAVIRNGVYLLDMMLPDVEPSVKETLDLISSEVEKAAETISDLLDFGRPRGLKRQEVAAEELVTMALARIPMPPEIEVQPRVLATLPRVVLDVEQVTLALCKLLDNAVKAMPQGGRLTLTACVTSDTFLITVTDTGVGIEAADLDRIFEPLFTTRAGSIGLGLPVARAIIEEHGGTVDAASELGRGSTFTVRLPAGREQGLEKSGLQIS